VTAARELQSARFEQMENIHYNAQMNTKHIREYCVGRSVQAITENGYGTTESFR
jgi:predicted ATPase with chaperone activity